MRTIWGSHLSQEFVWGQNWADNDGVSRLGSRNSKCSDFLVNFKTLLPTYFIKVNLCYANSVDKFITSK